ncbi:putative bifunctional diguanylate cyclase/phosphodiesterase [Prosthecomicrobium sp. N25]|uniref:putative bifunctional diguanylate cyclase/phosphodiesterase n=1 Tax=Prosthecomicrobium sp. N25 TaxID=3129254 RepID=UPI0030772AB7
MRRFLEPNSRLFVLRFVLAVLIPFLGVAAMAVPAVLVRSEAVVERTTRHDVAWTGAHGREELSALRAHVLGFALDGNPADQEAASLFHQILVSRVTTWRTGSFGSFVRAGPKRAAAVERLSTLVDAMEAPVSDLAKPGAVEGLRPLLAEAEILVDRVATDAFSYSNDEIAKTRADLLQLQRLQQVLIFGLLSCGFLLVALLVVQNRMLRQSNADQKAVSDRYAFVAAHDILTQLPNRATFRARLAAAQGGHVAVLAIDLDGFKPINDTLGHLMGDALLMSVGQRLAAAIASHPGNVASRFGGDEFFVLLADVTGLEDARERAAAVLDALRRPHDLDGQRMVVDATIGLALWGPETDRAENLLMQADLALNRAKVAGKGMIAVYEPDMSAEIEARRRLEAELAVAVTRGEFEPFYQPVVDLVSGEIVGVEALARWCHPTRGIVLPGQFIPAAESSGRIVDIGRIVLEKACRDAAAFALPVPVAVNLSTVQLIRTDVPRLVSESLAAAGIPPSRLKLEITESVMMRDEARSRQLVAQLRQMGVRVSLDDFGTGYSSLSYLRGFGFDELKIDRSFVLGLDEELESAAIVQTIVSLGRSLGLSVVAEGIETERQAALVMATGCTKGQGYLFATPMPAAALAEWMRRDAQPVWRTEAA